jgi:hypothetical protein
MRRKVAGLIGAAAFAAAFVAAPASAAPGAANGCLGTAVSANAHFSQQELGVGQGRFAHDEGFNIGQAIQDYHSQFCG